MLVWCVLEFPDVAVSEYGSEDRGEVADDDEEMEVSHRVVVAESQHVHQIQRQDRSNSPQ